MPTFLSHSNDSPSWKNIYLSEPTGPTLINFAETINQKLPNSSELNQYLLNCYGRFWISENNLYYWCHQNFNCGSKGDRNVMVQSLSINIISNKLIVRVNHQNVPTICLFQLYILLVKWGSNYQDLIESIIPHRKYFQNL